MRILESVRILGTALLLMCAARSSSGAPAAAALPFDRSCPVILDNDWAVDQYDLPYAMALASAGKINLRGIVVSNSYDEQYTGDSSGNTMRNYYLPNYRHIVNVGRSSGFTNVPDPVEGPHLSLTRPASGNIDETVPQDTPGTRLILAEARAATAAKPLVVVQGGQCTAAVSAYLMDRSIADKMVLAWLVGNVNEYSNNDYNGYVDSWAAYIALQRLRAVTVGYHGNPGLASITAARLRSDYPNNPLKTELLKIADGTGDAGQSFGPIEWDADGVGLTLLMHPEYIQASSNVSFDYFFTVSGHQMCHYRNDGASRYTFVTQGSSTVYTNSWWEAMLDPAAYHTSGGGTPDLVITSFSYANGIFQCTAKNQGTAPTPSNSGIGVAYSVDGVYRTWGAYSGVLAAGASVNIGTNGGAYVIPNGTHTISALVDDVFVVAESNENNNTATQSVTIGGGGGGQPDVIVTSLTYSNGVFTSTVRNQGTAATPSGIVIGVGYFVDGVQRTWGSVMGPLAAGASMTIGTHGGNYVIPNGTHTIRAWADDVNRFAESNESNNEYSQTITIGGGGGLPDLVLTSLSYSNGTFTCTAMNQGTAAVTPSFGVSFLVNGQWVTWGAHTTGVAAGASVTIGTWGDPYQIPSGTHTISAMVDDVFSVSESNESNNQISQSITIGGGGGGGLPDLILTSLSYSNGLFQCTAKNQGATAVPPGTGIGVSYIVDGHWVTWGAHVDGIPAGASVTIGTWGDPYVIPSGTHTISAMVDDVFTVAESNESNNTRTATVAAKEFVQNASADSGDGGACGATGLEALLALTLVAICRAGGSCRRSRP